MSNTFTTGDDGIDESDFSPFGDGESDDGVPGSDASAQEVIGYLTGASPEEASAWFVENFDSLPEHVQEDVERGVVSVTGAGVSQYESPEAVLPPPSGAATPIGGDPETVESAAAEADVDSAMVIPDEALDWVAGRILNNPEIDVSHLIPDGLTPTQQREFERELRTQGLDKATGDRQKALEEKGVPFDVAAAQVEAETTGTFEGVPRWVLEEYGMLTPEQKDRILAFYGDIYGTTFTDLEQLSNDSRINLSSPSAFHATVIESAIADTTPITEYAIQLPGVTEPFRVSADDAQIMADRYGMDMGAIAQLARIAHMSFGPDPDSRSEIHRYNVNELAALASILGLGGDLSATQQTAQDLAQKQAEVRRLRDAVKDLPSSVHSEAREQLAEAEAELDALRQAHGEGTDMTGENPPSPITAAAGQSAATMGPSMFQASQRYQSGLKQFDGDQYMALIYAGDPTLAQRIAASGGDPTNMTTDDVVGAWELLQKGGVVDGNANGLRPRNSEIISSLFGGYFEWDQRGQQRGGGGGGGRVRRQLDKEAVAQQVQQMWQGLFLSEAPDGVVDSMFDALQQALDAAPEGMEFNVSARIQDWLKGRADYGRLYSKKHEGQTEEEYQRQFRAATASMLGAEEDIDSVVAGMETGEYQTAVGSAFAGGLKSGDNSTLQERLARAANVVAANT